jgi:hypothetical protein
VLLMRKGVLKEGFYQNPYADFLANMPNFRTLKTGANTEMKLNLNAGDWCDSVRCSGPEEHGVGGQTVSFAPGDLLIVIYDVADTAEGHERGIWYGVEVASFKVHA